MSSKSIVEFESVSKTFGDDGEVAAISDVSFTIQHGETIAIMGPSGSGKSTILNLAAGLDIPTAGTIKIEGNLLTGLNDKELTRLRRERIGMIFQTFNLLPTLTALENVALPLRLRGEYQSTSSLRAAKLLDLVGLTDRASHFPDKMSGGERQRVAIARAMVTKPALLLADEPTGNLDTNSGQQVLEKIVELNDKFETTVMLVTHDSVAAGYCRRTMVVVDGRVQESVETS